ncbi:MAG: hypothetical protein KY475_16425 [Planctomycetes bacterium]|nr:hypothetical protein [Planctomycetota bacterium]
MHRNIVRFCALAALGLLAACSLVMWNGADAAPQAGQQPFRNAVEQREEVIRELREIKLLIKEQNALLRTLAPKGAPHAH